MILAWPLVGVAKVSKKKMTCWIGKVELLFRKVGRRAKQKVHSLVDTDELFDGSYSVIAAWYSPTKRHGIYNYNSVSDPTEYNLSHFVGLVRIDWIEGTSQYELVDKEEQLAALNAAVSRTKPAGKGSKRTVGEEEEALARRAAQQSAPHLSTQRDAQEVEASALARRRRMEARASATSTHPEVDAFLAEVAFVPGDQQQPQPQPQPQPQHVSHASSRYVPPPHEPHEPQSQPHEP